MFKSLSDIKQRWQDRYALSRIPPEHLPSPGYPKSAIRTLEQSLAIEVHPSLVQVLEDVNLNDIEFHTASFGGGSDYLKYLKEMNDGTWERKVSDDGFLNFGGAGGYTFLMNNETGVIYVHDMDNPAPLEQVASNLEEFICIAASIADTKWPPFKDRQEAIKSAEAYLDENNIVDGRRFWTDLIRKST
jgi:hypothetical protein